MSTRTVIEINHDYIRGSRKDDPFSPDAVAKLISFLTSGERWQDGELPGLKWLAQRHHSEAITIKVK